MKFKKWLLAEKEDLTRRAHIYSRTRVLLLTSVVLGFLVSLFWLWKKTSSPIIQAYDQQTFILIEKIKTPALVKFFSLITHLGSGYFIAGIFLILAIFLVINRRRRAAAVALLSLTGSGIFIFFLKSFFGRERPFGCLLPGDCLSFPSGHATISFYFYGLLAYLAFRFLPISRKQLLECWLVLGTIVFLVAFSRLFLGFHYLSDIIGGFFLGGSWLFLAILLIDFLY